MREVKEKLGGGAERGSVMLDESWAYWVVGTG